uniref:Single-stranded DNA binding protein n=1 Tax=Eunotogramma sp. TaxID=2219035 RepID=A0A2U9NPX3_9STRA|nr:hypothetical protein ycf41 [Eunotogramma sp.]
MNYASFIVKIIGKPEQSFFEDNTSVIEFPVQFSQIRKQNIETTFQVSIWGNLGYDIKHYYQVNDYIVIEGYISLRDFIPDHSNYPLDKQIEISVFKIYPFLLNPLKVEESNK